MNEKRKMHSKEVKQKAVELSNVRGNIQEIVWEFAVARSFFKTLKAELIDRTAFGSYEVAQAEIFKWIETSYSKNRRHASLGNLTIEEFEESTKIKNAA